MIRQESEEDLPSESNAENLAYVIYTSGSTGRPKGVLIEHRNAVAFLAWARKMFRKDDFAGVLASTSICFDLSIFELFAPLISGGRVILVENGLALGDVDIELKPTLVNTVPSVMAELLRLKKLPPSIHTVNLAGEPLKPSLVEAIYKETSARRVFDLYGPTETTTYSSYTLRTPGGIPSIGRPIDNTQIYILDSHLNPVPPGVTGELYIGGAGVARGYLNRPELSTEKFVRSPFSDTAGTRLYKTGDLAEYLPDGNIRYLGRVDNQIKLRGFRIELGEIEAVLNQHPMVRECVVVGRDDAGSDKRLAAYVVAPLQSGETANELRMFLKSKLPDFMIPSLFTFMETLPLTPNGKVDRKALPMPDFAQERSAHRYVGPRTAVETRLAEIWTEVIKTSPIGVHDNFFDIGGHSLLAMQVISRTRAAFDIEIPVRQLFDSPTIGEMAQEIEKSSLKQNKGDTPAILRTARDRYRVRPT
jgi:amino acid adenylation domain-containing protein